MDRPIIKLALGKKDVEEAFAIRREVFVNEQKMFKKTDRDKYDDIAQHLICIINGEIAGTVRIFPAKGGRSWIGGRLALKKKYRGTSGGMMLVKAAMELAKKKECRHFYATIQKQNISFFKRLGWKQVGSLFIYKGFKHVIMEAMLI